MKNNYFIPICIAAALIVAGGCTKKQIEPLNQVESQDSSKQSTQDLNLSNWKTFQNKDSGFEMLIPPEWSGWMEVDGPFANYIDDRYPFWIPQLGFGHWVSHEVEIDLTVKQSTSTIKEFNDKIGMRFGRDPKEVNINGYPAFVYTHALEAKDYESWQMLLIKRNDVYYYFDFHELAKTHEGAELNEKKWKVALSTLRLTDLPIETRKAIDAWGKNLETITRVSSSGTVIRPECQHIEDNYTGPILWNNPNWIQEDGVRRMDKYPIDKKYSHLKGMTDRVGILGWDLFARILTASDCGDDRVTQLMGDSLKSSYPIPVRFEVINPSKDLLKILQNGRYEIYKYSGDPSVYYGFSPKKTTIEDVIKLKPYSKEIKNVEEVG